MKRFYYFIIVGFAFFSLFTGSSPIAQDSDSSDMGIPDIDSLPSDSLSNSVSPSTDSTLVAVTSSPDSALVTVSGRPATQITPLTLELVSGDYQIEVSKEGYESLSHALNLIGNQRVSAQFILKSFPPLPIPAESLGFFYIPERPLLDINAADKLGRSYKQLAETFAIIPLVQGILARLIADEKTEKEANILIISGVVLSGGSLILSKIMSKRKRKKIEAENVRIAEDNRISAENNYQVDKAVKEKNDEALQEWLLENEGRGRVILDISPPH